MWDSTAAGSFLPARRPCRVEAGGQERRRRAAVISVQDRNAALSGSPRAVVPMTAPRIASLSDPALHHGHADAPETDAPISVVTVASSRIAGTGTRTGVIGEHRYVRPAGSA